MKALKTLVGVGAIFAVPLLIVVTGALVAIVFGYHPSIAFSAFIGTAAIVSVPCLLFGGIWMEVHNRRLIST